MAIRFHSYILPAPLPSLRQPSPKAPLDTISYLRALQTAWGERTRGGQKLDLLPATGEVTWAQLDEAVSKVMESEVLRNRKGGGPRDLPHGLVSRSLTATARLVPGASRQFAAFASAVRHYFGQAFRRGLATTKALREGKIDPAHHQEFISRLLGLGEHSVHDATVSGVAQETLDADGDPLSVRPIPYAENIRAAVAGKVPANAILEIGRPGKILQDAGIPDLPLRVRQSKIRKKRNKHSELTADALEALPAALENPVAVFISPGDRKAHGIITAIPTEQGPVTAYFSVREEAGELSLEAKSIYGRTPSRVLAELRDAEAAGLLAYRNKTALEDWIAQDAGASANADAAEQHTPTLEGLREFFSNSGDSQDSTITDSALSLRPAQPSNTDGDSTGKIHSKTDTPPHERTKEQAPDSGALRPERNSSNEAGNATERPTGHAGEHRLSGRGEGESTDQARDLGREITRAAAERDRRYLGQGSESTVFTFGPRSVLKEIHSEGVVTFGSDGRLVRSTDPQSIRDKVAVIKALSGLSTVAVEVDGRLSIVQERGGPITQAEYEALRLPHNIQPQPGWTYRITIDGHNFMVTDLHIDNFRKDVNGRIGVTDLVTGRVANNVSSLPDASDSSL